MKNVISYSVIIRFLLIVAVCLCQGCLSQRQDIRDCTITLPPVCKGDRCVVVFGAQLGLRPTEVSTFNPMVDANAAASQNGDAKADKE